MYFQISKREKSNIMQRHLQINTVIGTPIKGIPSLGRQPHLVTRSTSTKPQLTSKMDPLDGASYPENIKRFELLADHKKNNLNITPDFFRLYFQFHQDSDGLYAIESRCETKSRGIFIPQMITGNKEPQ